MATWQKIALEGDLPVIFSGGKQGLVPSPGASTGVPIGVDPSIYVLNARGTWIRTRSDSNVDSFSALSDTPRYNTNEVNRILKFVQGVRITDITHDSTSNTATVYCESQHGLSPSKSVTM